MESRSEQKKRQRLPRFTDRLPLGDQGLAVSPFCLGMVREAVTVCAAFDAGINFFFLSTDLHWPLYENARRGLRQLLRQFRIGARFGVESRNGYGQRLDTTLADDDAGFGARRAGKYGKEKNQNKKKIFFHYNIFLGSKLTVMTFH